MGSTAPFVGRVQHVVGGDSREDRHTEEMMTGPERPEFMSLTLRDFVRCMSPEMALHGTRQKPWGASRMVRFLRWTCRDGPRSASLLMTQTGHFDGRVQRLR